MSMVLVVYGTKTGCTAAIAERVAQCLMAAGATVHLQPASDKLDPAEYSAVVVGSGIRAGKWHAPVTEWVIANAAALRARPTAFFTACLTMGVSPEKVDEVRAYTDPLIAKSGVHPLGLGLFAGMNEPMKFSLPERLILRAMKTPQGDFRDWAAIDAWAAAVALKLGQKGRAA